MGNYELSIEAALKSVELTPEEFDLPGPHAVDLAILAMCHHELGNQEEANEFREQLDESMRLDTFKDDEACQSFLAEVSVLFNSGSPR